MGRAATDTKDRILDATESLVMLNGFAATSIDKLVEKAGVTKGTFFYYFKSKSDLARSLAERYAQKDEMLLNELWNRSENLSRDPLQQLLIFVGLFIEMGSQMSDPQPGCLFATYCYEQTQFDQQTRNVCSASFLKWRDKVGNKLREIAALYPPEISVDYDSLADFLSVTFEGAYVLGRTFRDASALSKHLIHYRNYLETLFSGNKRTTSESE